MGDNKEKLNKFEMDKSSTRANLSYSTWVRAKEKFDEKIVNLLAEEIANTYNKDTYKGAKEIWYSVFSKEEKVLIELKNIDLHGVKPSAIETAQEFCDRMDQEEGKSWNTDDDLLVEKIKQYAEYYHSAMIEKEKNNI